MLHCFSAHDEVVFMFGENYCVIKTETVTVNSGVSMQTPFWWYHFSCVHAYIHPV